MAIAIVSAGIRFPGATNLEDLWKLLGAGKNLAAPVSPGRWPAEGQRFQNRAEDAIVHDRVYEVAPLCETASGLLISQEEWDGLDPLFHLTLGAGRDAFAAARRAGIEEQRMGVILGAIALPTAASSQRTYAWLRGEKASLPSWARDSRNNDPAAHPARVLAAALGIAGQVYTLDAACASSLYAIKLACDALENRTQDFMLAGGVSRPYSLYTQIGFTALQALSPRGVCAALDERADGLMVGEGAGIFGLKRLPDAIADGDEIWGVIRGIGLSNDREGRLMAPSRGGQLRAMRAAYQKAGWRPDELDCIECHATGTPLGDGTEIASLRTLWEGARPGSGAVLGSVKPNLGHMLTAAGAAGLAKLLVGLRKKTFLPTANYEASPSSWQLEQSSFRILKKPESWPARRDRPRRAALSGFGFGGINAHLLLEEFDPARAAAAPEPARKKEPDHEVVLVAMSSLGPESSRGYQLVESAEGDRVLASFELGYKQFRIPPSELAEVLPQQILGLLSAEQLSLPQLPDSLAEETACLVGLALDPATNLYASRWEDLHEASTPDSDIPPLSANRVIGSLGSIVASRIARELHLGGPSFTLAAQELSGLQALALGAEQIRRGEIAAALVLGLDLPAGGRGRAQILEEGHGPLPKLADRGLAFFLMRRDKAEALGFKALAHIGAVASSYRAPSGGEKELSAESSAFFSGAAQGLAVLFEELERRLETRGEQSFRYRSREGAIFELSYETLMNQASHAPRQSLEPSYQVRRWDHELNPAPAPLVSASPRAGLRPQFSLEKLLALEQQQILSHQEFLRYRSEGDALLEALLKLPRRPERVSSQKSPSVLFDYNACREFARGSIAKVFGPAFAVVDSFPTRVRLPDDKLLLCHRVLKIEGEAKSLGAGTIITEHDVVRGAWYLENEQMPISIAVESGQADLMLAAYLGADFHTRGEAVYRLLDARVSFHRHLPRVGETIRYEIRIKRFFEQGGLLFFHFGFEASIAGEPLMSMRDGCAGFFTQEALASGRGVKRSPLQLKAEPGKFTGGFQPLVPSARLSLDETTVDYLRKGDYEKAFGPSFAGLRIQDPSRLPDGAMRLVQRVIDLEPQGGRYGCGRIVAEAEIEPDAWFLTCHFVDDQVMPGTLMYECCLQTLRILLMRLGWVGESETLRFQPREGLWSQLKCRGQVLASTQRVQYDIEVKEIGYGPEAYVICDALMSADGRAIVDITDMSLSLPGCDLASFTELWQRRQLPAYNAAQILAFASGRPSDCFGPVYSVFDEERRIARLPRPPYQFLDGIERVDGPFMQQHVGTSLTAFYEPPEDAWYWSQGLMPFAVLVEVALQPCGFMAAYMGSALLSKTDLSFRNLGGEAHWRQRVERGSGTLWIDVSSTKISRNGDMIIQDYDFLVRNARGPVYEGKTSFGFFTHAALLQQVGLRQQPRWQDPGPAIDLSYPSAPSLPKPPLLMVDELGAQPAPQGRYQQGVLFGQKRIRKWQPAPTEEKGTQRDLRGDWFFDAHFYQDPVMPGSLGLEALEQVLKAEAHRRWPSVEVWEQALGVPVRWTYRGQVTPRAGVLHYEVHLKKVEQETQRLQADAWLYCDGLPIYALEDLILQPLSGD